jgi:hypothetical protein
VKRGSPYLVSFSFNVNFFLFFTIAVQILSNQNQQRVPWKRKEKKREENKALFLFIIFLRGKIKRKEPVSDQEPERLTCLILLVLNDLVVKIHKFT